MQANKKYLCIMTVSSVLLSIPTFTFAEDWAISAIGSCTTALGNTSSFNGGLRANGNGSSVIKCPMTKEVGTNTINNVYVRMKRANINGADPFCYVFNTPNYGSPTSFVNKSASDTTNNQSINLTLGTQSFSGYADTYCVLTPGDIMYGVRYRQDN